MKNGVRSRPAEPGFARNGGLRPLSVIPTPNLDRIANNALRYTNFNSIPNPCYAFLNLGFTLSLTRSSRFKVQTRKEWSWPSRCMTRKVLEPSFLRGSLAQ